jgi:hypothetical protein
MTGYVRKVTALAVALASITLLCTATPARADLTIQVAEDGGSLVTVASATGSPVGGLGAGTFAVDTADYHLDFVSALENQLPSLSKLLSSTTDVTNTSGSAGHTLHIVITGSGFTSPTTPPDVSVLSHIGGTVDTVAPGNPVNTLTFHSFVVDAPVDIGAQTPGIGSVGSFKDDKSAILTTLDSPFSIMETLDIVLNGQGDSIGYQTSTTLAPVPAPATMALACSIVPLVGWGAWRRQRPVAVVC